MGVWIDQKKCKGCDLCLNLCPRGVFKEIEQINVKGFKTRIAANSNKCNGCNLCKFFCPDGAIILNGQSTVEEFWEKARKIKEKIKTENQPRGGWKKVKTYLPGKIFVSGNEACVLASRDAGCDAYYGYPITPVNEITHEKEKEIRERGGSFYQMESEDATIAAMIGASLAGAKVMTATSDPGFARMQEGLSFAYANEIPMVVVVAQRTSPSTGRPTGTGAFLVREARWGAHGGTEHIVLYPSSPQEIYDYTVKAFNLAEKVRTPVILLFEASIAHLKERIEIPKEIEVFDRIYKPGEAHFGPTKNKIIPSLPRYGEGELLKVTGLTHNRWGVPCPNEPTVQEELVEHLREKIISLTDKLTQEFVEEYYLEDAQIMIVAYGQVARAAKWAVKEARKRGIKVGLLKLGIISPFPEKKIEEWSKKVQRVDVPEMNQGQLFYVIRESCAAPVISLTQPDGESIDPRRILNHLVRFQRKFYRMTPPVIYPTIYNPFSWQRKKEKIPEKNFTSITPMCPGCLIGIVNNCQREALKELKRDLIKRVKISGIGCSSRPSNHEGCDSANLWHGYSVAFSTGVIQVQPNLNLEVDGGDGDLFDIGLSQTLHGAKRNIPIVLTCINNFNYGMTGGQVASTTPLGAKTSTTPLGNSEKPFDLVKLMLSANAEFVARCPISKPLILKKIFKEAMEFTVKENKFAFVEVIAPCLTYYGRKNGLGSASEVINRLNQTFVSKETAKTISLSELKRRFGLFFPFRKDFGKIKEEELLQIVYGRFSSLKEYLSVLPEEK